MEITVEKIGDVAVVAMPVAELDAANTAEFKRDMAPVLEAEREGRARSDQLRFIDSSGLGAFLSCLRKLNEKGGDLKLCGMSKQVRTVVRTGAHASHARYLGTREEAVRAFNA